jgi:hypothetical protein
VRLRFGRLTTCEKPDGDGADNGGRDRNSRGGAENAEEEARKDLQKGVGGKARASSQQTSPDLPPPDESARRTTHQFRKRHEPRRSQPHRQYSPQLRVSASPREPMPPMVSVSHNIGGLGFENGP